MIGPKTSIAPLCLVLLSGCSALSPANKPDATPPAETAAPPAPPENTATAATATATATAVASAAPAPAVIPPLEGSKLDAAAVIGQDPATLSIKVFQGLKQDMTPDEVASVFPEAKGKALKGEILRVPTKAIPGVNSYQFHFTQGKLDSAVLKLEKAESTQAQWDYLIKVFTAKYGVPPTDSDAKRARWKIRRGDKDRYPTLSAPSTAADGFGVSGALE